MIASERSPQPRWHGEYRNEYSPERGARRIVVEHGGAALKFLVRWRPDRPVVRG